MLQLFISRPYPAAVRQLCNWLLLLPCLALLPVTTMAGEVVLKVGDESFLRYELDEAVNRLLPSSAYHGGIADKTRQQYTRKAINLLTERALLYRAARQAGYQADDDVLQKAEKRNIDHFDSREEFIRQLDKRGFSYDRFKTQVMAANVITKYVTQTIVKQATYSDEQLRDYYNDHPREFQRPESVGVWHIILKVSPNAPTKEWKKKKQLADSLLKQIRDGASFTDIASKHSEDDYRIKGGWIGYMHKGRMLQELEDAVFSLKKNEIAGPIKSLQGYHIVKAGERKSAGKTSFKDAKDKLKKRLQQERFSQLRKEVLDKQRKQVKIKLLIKLD